MFNVDFYEDLAWGKPNIDVDNESFIKVDAYIYIYIPIFLKKKSWFSTSMLNIPHVRI